MESIVSNAGSACEQKLRFWARAIKVALWFVILPPMIGLAGTVIGMIRVFNEVGEGAPADPATLATFISTSLIATAIGLVIAFPAFVILIVAIVRHYRIKRPES